MRCKVFEGGVEIGADALCGEVGHVRLREFHVVIRQGVHRVAVEQLRRDRVVARGSEPACDVFDVVVDAERLLDYDDGGTRRRSFHLVYR